VGESSNHHSGFTFFPLQFLHAVSFCSRPPLVAPVVRRETLRVCRRRLSVARRQCPTRVSFAANARPPLLVVLLQLHMIMKTSVLCPRGAGGKACALLF
jgi:hypothetical protein